MMETKELVLNFKKKWFYIPKYAAGSMTHSGI
jgi:hypothetical protein